MEQGDPQMTQMNADDLAPNAKLRHETAAFIRIFICGHLRPSADGFF
jgi:hypothetical protein